VFLASTLTATLSNLEFDGRRADDRSSRRRAGEEMWLARGEGTNALTQARVVRPTAMTAKEVLMIRLFCLSQIARVLEPRIRIYSDQISPICDQKTPGCSIIPASESGTPFRGLRMNGNLLVARNIL
jgi:hypothetical protein